MDTSLREYLRNLHAEGRDVDAGLDDRRDRRRNIEPESAALLATLIRHRRASRVLEVGTSNGYSTLWLAAALAETNGSLRSVEIDPARSAAAAGHLRATGLDERVELLVADAGEQLRIEEGPVDLILLDAERPEYPAYLADLLRLLDPRGGLLVVDNAISHAEQITEFSRALAERDDLACELVDVGAGLLMAVRR